MNETPAGQQGMELQKGRRKVGCYQIHALCYWWPHYNILVFIHRQEDRKTDMITLTTLPIKNKGCRPIGPSLINPQEKNKR
jgi:hypothetical protein